MQRLQTSDSSVTAVRCRLEGLPQDLGQRTFQPVSCGTLASQLTTGRDFGRMHTGVVCFSYGGVTHVRRLARSN